MSEQQELKMPSYIPQKPWRNENFVRAFAQMTNVQLARKFGGSEKRWREARYNFDVPRWDEVPHPLGVWDDEAEQQKAVTAQAPSDEDITDEMLSQGIEHEVQIQQLHAKLKMANRRYEILKNDLAVKTNFYDMLKETIVAMPPVKPPKPTKLDKKMSVETMVALLSDLHIDDIIRPSQTLGFGEYNFKLFQQRMEKWVHGIVGISQNKLTGCHFPTLMIPMIGDLVSGNIHEELRENRDGTINHAIVGGAFVIAQALMDLAQVFENIEVVAVPGNHGRMTKKPTYKNRTENFDMLLVDMVAMLTMNQPNISIVSSPAWAAIVEVEGHSLWLSHGDTMKSWNGVPYYGINRMRGNLREMMAFRGDHIDILCIGHYHQMGYTSGPTIMNGSMSGPDEFSVTNGMGVDHPHQVMFGMHKEQGVTAIYKLRLDRADEMFPEPKYVYDPELSVQEQAREMFGR